jgi:hypothetical protein
MAPALHAQQKRPYIGYVYPAGGRQGTKFQIKLGGQNLDDVDAVRVTGAGVSARVVEYDRRLNNQEVQLLKEQLKDLRRASRSAPGAAAENPMMSTMAAETPAGATGKDKTGAALIEIIERRTSESVKTPACASIANLVLVEVTLTRDAPVGPRELRLITPRGVSNPLVFHVGQVPESSREPMLCAKLQVLGKEAASLRKRPAEEAEKRITLPCTVNGQIASGEVNRYRFQARKGQRLVISTQARELIPYIADAVPGWFQPVLALYDDQGREASYADDYRFKPDPVIFYQVPEDGEYVFAIRDSLYRGREDFVYRISAGELPFVTSVFPLGGPASASVSPRMTGWGLGTAKPVAPSGSREPGPIPLVAMNKGIQSNHVPFMLDRFPEVRDREPNDSSAQAQKVLLPVMVNGHIGRPDDWDVYRFSGRAHDTVVIEVQARRLDSPLDSLVTLTDAEGKVLAFNDDCEDLAAGINTHHADSYLMTALPADGIYRVHIGDAARHSGEAYGYRLRISAPQPDFELRVVPSSVSLPMKGSATVNVHAMRKDGFDGPIQVSLKNPPSEFTAAPLVIAANQTVAKLTLKAGPKAGTAPVVLGVVGSAMLGKQDTEHDALPAEDRMQAFLWRHLVPANELLALVFDPKSEPHPKRALPPRPPQAAAVKPPDESGRKFTKQQIAGRLRQLNSLYQDGLITGAFYNEQVSDCEAAQ